MNFGVFSPIQDGGTGSSIQQAFADTVSLAKTAEKYNFSYFGIPEHHQATDGYFSYPLIPCAALARETRTIKIGSTVLLAPLYHPIQVAEQGAMVDIVSEGRFFLGVGAGYSLSDFASFQLPKEGHGERFGESVRIIREAWASGKVGFQGKSFDIKDVVVSPRPVQKPHPPIWMGANTHTGLRRVGRMGLPWIQEITHTIDTLKEMSEIYSEACNDSGCSPESIAMRYCWVGDTSEAAENQFGPLVIGSFEYYYKIGGFMPKFEKWLKPYPQTKLTLEKLKPRRLILGSPDDCIAQIEQWQKELHVSHMFLQFRVPYNGAMQPALDECLRTVKMFGEKVIPYFSER